MLNAVENRSRSRAGDRGARRRFAKANPFRLWLLAGLWLVALSVLPVEVQAHAPEGTRVSEEWWLHWTWSPLVLSNLFLVAGVYGRGLYNLWSKTGIGRVISTRQAVLFGSGWLALFIALISPLDALSDELSAAHMVQHMTLMNVAAPLLVLGAPGVVLLWALPLRWRSVVGRWYRAPEHWQSAWYLLWQPVLMWSLYAFTLWIWHLPALYEAALRNELFHDFQHFTFLIASALFWRVLLDPVSRLRLGRGVAVLYLFTTSLHATVLGVFMALAPRVWYIEYVGRTEVWKLSPLEDQQLAGLIMWMPACMIYAVVAAVVFAIWLEEKPRDLRENQAHS
jgi:putative membrane protein